MTKTFLRVVRNALHGCVKSVKTEFPVVGILRHHFRNERGASVSPRRTREAASPPDSIEPLQQHDYTFEQALKRETPTPKKSPAFNAAALVAKKRKPLA